MEFEFREQQRGRAPRRRLANSGTVRPNFLTGEDFNERPVLVRFIISDIKPESGKFEQSFSTNDGSTTRQNWLALRRTGVKQFLDSTTRSRRLSEFNDSRGDRQPYTNGGSSVRQTCRCKKGAWLRVRGPQLWIE
jgi:hypothetical protein